MKSSVSIDQIIRKFYRFIHRYHLVVFVVIVMGGMAVVMFMLNNTIQSSTDTNALNSTSMQAGFDQATIEKLESLETSSNASKQLRFPSGRINPFVE